MFPHGFSFCRTRGDAPGVGFYLNGYDRVDPSPRDHWLQHVLKRGVSGLRSMAYLATRGRCWSAGSSSNGGRRDHNHHRDLLPSDGGRSSKSWTTRSHDHRTAGDGAPWWWIEWLSIAIWRPRWRAILTIHLTWRAPSDGADKARKNPTIAVRSSCDRAAIVARLSRDCGAIEPRSHLFCGGIAPTWSDDDRWRPRITIEPQSWPDCGPIVARSWCFWEEIGAQSTAKFGQKSSRNWSHVLAKWKRSHDPCKTPPRPLQWPTILGPISPLKACISLLWT